MKKYGLKNRNYDGFPATMMVADENGSWFPAVKAEQMLEDYTKILTYVQAHYPNDITLIDMIKTAIKEYE
jgi:hypothetical protein